jgi:hypothetical protein
MSRVEDPRFSTSQLRIGLKLVAKKQATDILVIDRAEQTPTYSAPLAHCTNSIRGISKRRSA